MKRRWGNPHRQIRADDGIRTRDPHLGKVMRYQLRYVRVSHSGPVLVLLYRSFLKLSVER